MQEGQIRYNTGMEKEIKILLCSDNHGLKEPMMALRNMYPDVDYFIHCGDALVEKQYLDGYAVVQGNNDYYDSFPNELVLTIGSYKILVTHGHRYIWFYNYEDLATVAKSKGCDMVFFGHTHIPFGERIDDVICLNPGSLRHNRDNSEPGYYIVTINGDSVTWEKKVYKM